MRDTGRNRLVLGVLLVASLVLITLDYRGGDNSPLNGLRGLGATVFGPLERVAASVVRPVGNTFDAIRDAPGQRNRASDLLKENQELREQLRSNTIDKGRATQLEKLLGSAGLGGYKIVAANVISAGQGFEDTVTIDVGTLSGVKPDMTVMTGDGLVGRVIKSGPASATVLLATDSASTVGARMETSKEIGVVTGTGRRGFGVGAATLRLELLAPDVRLSPGQRVVTLGSQDDRPYVPGVPIGVVEKVEQTPGALTRTALIRPFVHFSGLDVVGVVVAPPQRDPHDAVLPPRPSTPSSGDPQGS
ncbi:rod shape-determining protein MreC [Actinocorallia sp. A-T 12471]|uniref:rod shape-determining protein MreC n=1 Tax=Actinocorallia sp. A-T 12471 TaxID=3089813 RepID=UPI0029D32C38|nr:rod shape-determining protein MreC [Actinocorallia sp. A-T 12471]MDX6742957.1 rod shape-determining protein MreC [Actinocorallia sp. A-T 12471]